MRLAWFTPFPPVKSGIADYSAELAGTLTARHAVAFFVASKAERQWGIGRGFEVCDAHEFVWRHFRQRYDLIVYQMGNSSCHEFMWPYLFQFPGLVVLHDGQLHHARGKALLRRSRTDDYRAELRYSHPDLAPDAAEIALSGFAGSIYYFWPMIKVVIDASRTVAVHSVGLAERLRGDFPAVPIHRIRLGTIDPLATAAPGGRDIRRRHGLPDDAVVIGAFGGVTPEKRIPQLIRAVARLAPVRPDLRLLLVGDVAPYYDPVVDASRAGIADRVIVTRYVPDAELPGYMAAADIAACLRWPSAGETSASWLRCLAAGLPTIVIDLAHQAELPLLDPRTWTVQHGHASLTPPAAIAVGIDILDEDHSLGLALGRLITDAPLRRQLGSAGRAFWRRDHQLDGTATDYEQLLPLAAAAPDPAAPKLPAHLRPDPLDHARALLAECGITRADLGL